ncbi:DUF927 domain-containing protein [Paracoccus versutus]|uniref:DUF927 domain-containing protein n=1 Tax=Paracoccus versutus TaxID=34007 RepID=UPI000DF7FEDD|nr:DUF927 domain-containing protein [Paracoccus versutus]RDD70154.1 DUF927 domain-containing protein [Paracoccus versutus]
MPDNNIIDAQQPSALPEIPLTPTDAGQAPLPDGVIEETIEAGLRALHHDPEIAAFLIAMRQELPPFWTHLPRERMLGYGGIEDEWVPMCGPLRIEALTRDGSGRNWGRRIRFLDRDGQLRQETISEADILGKPRSVCAQLISAGLAIEGNRNDIIELIRRWPAVARILSVSRPGWMAETDVAPAYLLPDGKLLSAEPQRGETVELIHARSAVPPSGSLDDWKDTVGCLAVDNPALICAISAVLAGPLLKHAGIETLGLNLHASTSSGKTTALIAAQSCIGPPALDRWNATNTALELVCERAHDGVLMLDEFPAQPSPAIIEALYMIGNGTGRARGNRKLTLEETAHWRTVLLSTSEKPIERILADVRIRMPEGIGVRLIDIPARSWEFGLFRTLHGHGSGHAFAEALQQAARQHYGHVLPAFVQRVIAHQGLLRETLPLMIERLRTLMLAAVGLPPNAKEGPVLRVLNRLALIAAAGEIGSRLGILPWRKGTATSALVEIAGIWHRAHAARPPSTAEAMVARLAGYLRQNRHRLCPPGTEPDPDAIGWCDARWIYLGIEAFRTDIASGMPASLAVQLLADAGLLVPGGEQRSFQYRLPRCVDPDRARVYRLDRQRIEGG